MREPCTGKLVVVVRECLQSPGERGERAAFALLVRNAVREVTQLFEQNAVPRVWEVVQLRARLPGRDFQLHIVSQLAQIVDVAMQF